MIYLKEPFFEHALSFVDEMYSPSTLTSSGPFATNEAPVDSNSSQGISTSFETPAENIFSPVQDTRPYQKTKITNYFSVKSKCFEEDVNVNDDNSLANLTCGWIFKEHITFQGNLRKKIISKTNSNIRFETQKDLDHYLKFTKFCHHHCGKKSMVKEYRKTKQQAFKRPKRIRLGGISGQ